MPLSSSSNIHYLISNTSKPIVRIGDQTFTTESLATFATQEADAAAFAAELYETTLPLLTSHPVPGVTTPVDYINHLLSVGLTAVFRPNPPFPPPTAAPAAASSSVHEDTSRTPTGPTTPLPPIFKIPPAATASPSPPRKKPKKRKHGASSPGSPPPPPASSPPSHTPTPAPPSPMRTDPPPGAHPPPALPPPIRCSPSSAGAFDKVLGTLASLRREALKLIQRRPSRASTASASRPLSYAAAVRGGRDPHASFPVPVSPFIYVYPDLRSRWRGKEPRR